MSDEVKTMTCKEGELAHGVTDARLHQLPLEKLRLNPANPRNQVDHQELEGLAQTIRAHGVLSPVLYQMGEDRIPEIIAGGRRVVAAKMAGCESIPALLIDGKDADEIALIENVSREDLHPVDEAEAMANILKRKKYKQADLAEIVGKAPNTVSELLRIARMPEEVKKRARQCPCISRRLLVEVSKLSEAAMMEAIDAHAEGKCTGDDVRKKSRPASSKPCGGLVAAVSKFTEQLEEAKVDVLAEADRVSLRAVLVELQAAVGSALKIIDDFGGYAP